MELMPNCVNDTQKTASKTADVPLAEYSPQDSKWDTQRAAVQSMSEFLFEVQRFEKWAVRMNDCTRTLKFNEIVNQETNEIKPKLVNAFFCHCRHCQICDARRSLVRMKRFKDYLPAIEKEHPRARWIFLTLTVPNCHVTELRATLGEMNKGWQRLIKRKEFKPVLGFIRTTEVTQEKSRKDYAHPHFHCLLLVPSSMLGGKYYVKQSDWADMWRSCMRLDVNPVVDVRAVKNGAVRGAVETLKAFNYSMKVDDLISRTPDFILEYMKQVHKLRFLALGGVLKSALKKIEEDASTEEMLGLAEAEKESEGFVKIATWRPGERRYRMKK